MDSRKFSVVAIGCAQSLSVAGGVRAQQSTLVDLRCSLIPMCSDTPRCPLDVGQCQILTNGSVDLFTCAGGAQVGQPCTTSADCPGASCQHSAQGEIPDACVCAPDKGGCVTLQGPGDALTCGDFGCSAQGPNFSCDPLTCQCTVVDHLKCYTIKDPQNLSGIVDLTSAQFGLEKGCTIKKATKFCVPVTKIVTKAEVNKIPITLLPGVGPAVLSDYICYKITCKKPFPPDTKVQDQFGTRTFTKFKAFELCGPAKKVP